MSKIIPWNLPEVAGGSTGGYTPEPEPEPPTPSSYINVDNLSISSSMSLSLPDDKQSYINAGVPITTSDATIPGGGTFQGMVAENLIGVASVQLIVSSEVVYSLAQWTYKTTDLVYDVDPITMVCTFNSGTFEVENTWSNPQKLTVVYPYRNDGTTTSCKVTLVVYNGNGEIIQTQEVTIV